MSKNFKRAIEIIEKQGVVTVFPSKTARKIRPSLFELLHPRSKFSWEWTDDGSDDKVVKLWWLKNELARSREVLYGRFFTSQPMLLSMKFAREHIRELKKLRPLEQGLAPFARNVLESLRDNSPQTRRMLKRSLLDDGKFFDPKDFEKAVSELQKRCLIVNLGDSERENGPMPSTEFAATELIFPELF